MYEWEIGFEEERNNREQGEGGQIREKGPTDKEISIWKLDFSWLALYSSELVLGHWCWLYHA